MKIPENGLQRLRNGFELLSPLPDSEWEYFCSYLGAKIFNPDELLFKAGEPVTNFYFIISGLVRYFYLTEAGKECNKAFAMENDMVGSLSALVLKTPCRYSVQALERSEVLILPVKVLEDCFDRHPAWERIGRLHAERVAVKKEIREGEFLLDSAEVRYKRLLAEHPALIDRVRQYHIASYLGITDVTLSRIRNKIKNNRNQYPRN